MSRKYLTQWAKAAEEWQDANNNMLEAVEEMIEVEKPLQTEEITYICPSCGTEFTQGDWNYNYDSGLLDFECDCCGWTGTENQLNEEDEEDEE